MSSEAASRTVLPEEIRQALAELSQHYPTREALLLPALHMAQKHWEGWLPEAAIEAVAMELELAPARVYGVVTFYDLFHDKPVGRHRIRVCDNISCTLRGAREILEAIEDELGVPQNIVTDDERCSFAHFECLGSCDTAPMMMVDDQYHENLTPAKAREIVRELD
jgi:NADH-quinone oxidoreductase subunit E